MKQRIRILGVPIDPITSSEALDRIKDFVRSGLPHQIATVNPEFIMAAQNNSAFQQVLQTTNLNIADGVGIRLAATLIAKPMPAVITGIDLLTSIATESVSKGWRLYLLGGRPTIAHRAAEALRQRYPKIQIVGAEEGLQQGQPNPDTQALIDRIRHAKPDVLFVAFGAPKQDLFIADHKAELNVPVMMGVGGSFDFLAGVATRAPLWLRSLGLEWLWRLALEPWRLPRIITATVRFPLRVMWAAIQRQSV